MSTKLYVGNLSYNTTESALEDLFAQHGQVTAVNLIMDKMTGRSKGFAFVTMATPEEAQNAIKATNGSTLDGRQIVVNEARPQTDRPSRPKFGGGSGGSGGGGGDRGPRKRRF